MKRIIVRIEPYGALLYLKNRPVTIRLNRDEARRLLRYKGEFPGDLTSPEVVHCEVSNRCNKHCRYCYVDKRGEELSTEQWKRIFEDLAKNKVLQLTFGGGEPFMREDLFELASYADDLGMNTAVTTNGTFVVDDPLLSLFKQMNFSFHGNLDELKPKIELARRYTETGINFVVRKDSLNRLHDVAEFCRSNDTELLLLSYKPVKGDWEEMVEPEKVLRLAERLTREGTRIAVDGMTCGKCFAARRFVDIGSTGDVYPCSFLREPLGNVLRESFQSIWSKRKIPTRCPYQKNQAT